MAANGSTSAHEKLLKLLKYTSGERRDVNAAIAKHICEHPELSPLVKYYTSSHRYILQDAVERLRRGLMRALYERDARAVLRLLEDHPWLARMRYTRVAMPHDGPDFDGYATRLHQSVRTDGTKPFEEEERNGLFTYFIERRYWNSTWLPVIHRLTRGMSMDAVVACIKIAKTRGKDYLLESRNHDDEIRMWVRKRLGLTMS